MGIEQEPMLLTPTKTSIFTKIKIILAVILMFLIVIASTFGILYFTNPRAKEIINKEIQAYRAQKEMKEKSQAQLFSDPRISELAKFYLEMDDNEAAKKMIDIRKSDKKAFEKIVSSMSVINAEKTAIIKSNMKSLDSKKDIVKQEYDMMLAKRVEENLDISKYYKNLGIKGAIDAIQKELQSTMNYDKVSGSLSKMDAKTAARILYYVNPIYKDGIRSRLEKTFLNNIDKETQNYSEFLRKNLSIGQLYGKTEEKIAAKELEDIKKFKTDDLAIIFSGMDYFDAARILNKFSDESKVQEILTKIKAIEDYQIDFQGSYSTVVANSIKVLKKYNEDVDILKKAYEKMQAADLAQIIDKLATSNPVYKIYKIDNTRSFDITEKQMAVEALKRMKPVLVGDVLAELKNTKKVDKAAYLSREIGIPEPTN